MSIEEGLAKILAGELGVDALDVGRALVAATERVTSLESEVNTWKVEAERRHDMWQSREADLTKARESLDRARQKLSELVEAVG